MWIVGLSDETREKDARATVAPAKLRSVAEALASVKKKLSASCVESANS